MSKETNFSIGKVTESLADARFKVELESGEEILCYLAGKLRYKRINIIVGDSVKVVIDPMKGKATNRIIWRL